MITIRRYPESTAPESNAAGPGAGRITALVTGNYRSLLEAIGKYAVQGCPPIGADLDRNLRSLNQELAGEPSPEALRSTKEKAEAQLQAWAERTSEYLRAKAEEVRQLITALAKTAESLSGWNQDYAERFKGLTVTLEAIADLDDVTQIRSSLEKGVSELRSGVDQMMRDNSALMQNLQKEVSLYETRIKVVETLVSHDNLTGIHSRRSIEDRMQLGLEEKQQFCVVMLDLNRFKFINDEYGHLAGDELLKQFAKRLKSQVRSSDVVGRWGGDEFIVLLFSDAAAAQAQIRRVREAVFGRYSLQSGKRWSPVEIHMDASIGMAEFSIGDTMQSLIAKADANMYEDKRKHHMPLADTR